MFKINMDKRYCQNRQRKRKRTIVKSPTEKENVSPSEEERQFKLSRFVEDVGKFLTEKESCPDQKIATKTKTSTKKQRSVKRVNIPESKVKKSLFQNRGLQTTFCTRNGVMTREMTAKLDENLHKIISLVSSNQCNHLCQCTYHCKKKNERLAGSGPFEHRVESVTLTPAPSTSVLRLPQSRSSPGFPRSPSPPSDRVPVEGRAVMSGSNSGKSLSELDKELYPLFARVVTESCSQTKATLFKNQSYVSGVKKKLIQIYVNGINESKEQRSCLNEPKKDTRSVGTSSLPSSVKTQSSHQNTTDPSFKLVPAKVHFQSTMQFLEETIGPSSSCSSKQAIPSPQCCQPHLQLSRPPDRHSRTYLQSRQPSTLLLSPPMVGYNRLQRVSTYVPGASRYQHEPFLPTSPAGTLLSNLRSKVFDGSGDGIGLNCFNSFLPPVEEESPDFRYYPKKLF